MIRDRAGDTIAAIATAPGRGALAIVRLSGARALAIGEALIRPWPSEPRHVRLSEIRDSAGDLLDDAMVVFYRGPASFTGEDAVEVTCHGGPVASALIAGAFVAAGARPAAPGEFTRRAVLNGKLDLLQAEAIADLVDAATRPAQRIALAQLDGGLSRRILALREEVLALEAMSAYDIDFPEEDDGPIPKARILAATRRVVHALDALLATAPTGEVVRAGALVVIAGAPNVGKSSLFNALLGRRRAIVTEIPGTTRDALEAVTEAEEWPVRLVDTAGLRDTAEIVERMGIEMSREYVERADVVLACGDTDHALESAVAAVASIAPVPIVRVRTKSDLGEREPRATQQNDAVFVSAESGEGLGDLARRIADKLRRSKGSISVDAPLLTRERHRHALERAREELAGFLTASETESVPAVVAAVHLREATRELEELIGAVEVNDVLDRLFSAFCVGK